jgi:hypothetical protein
MRLAGWFRAICTLGALQLGAVGPTEALQDELRRYYDSTKSICRTGVTAERTSAYEQARQAMDRARATGGLGGNNFAGIKMPQELWLDCFQAPGDGKT